MWTWSDVDEACLESMVIDYPELPLFISSIKTLHGKAMMSYLTYMAQHIIQLHRVLKDTGSIYQRCDPTASHYLKLIMDAVFGKNNFRNEIVWKYGLGGSSKRFFSRKHDILFFYTKGDGYLFNKPTIPATSQRMKRKKKGMLDVWTDIPSLNNQAKKRVGYPTLYQVICS